MRDTFSFPAVTIVNQSLFEGLVVVLRRRGLLSDADLGEVIALARERIADPSEESPTGAAAEALTILDMLAAQRG